MRVYVGTALTPTEAIADAAVAVEAGRIAYVGPRAAAPEAHKGGRVRDAPTFQGTPSAPAGQTCHAAEPCPPGVLSHTRRGRTMSQSISATAALMASTYSSRPHSTDSAVGGDMAAMSWSPTMWATAPSATAGTACA